MVSRGSCALISRVKTCPCCGSPDTASRRQLFLWLMGEVAAPGPFIWYDERHPRAMPPSSLAILPGLLLAGMILPMLGFWVLGYQAALGWLAALALVVLAALLVDLLSTYRRYRLWGREWLCADCRETFTLPDLAA